MAIGTNGISGAPALGSGGVAGSATGFVPSVPGSSVPSYTPGSGSAPGDGPYLLYTADSDIPDGIVYLPVVCQATAPTIYYVIWVDTSTTPPTPNYWNGSAWTPWPDVSGITLPIAASNISVAALPWTDAQSALAGILALILAVNHIIAGGIITNVATTYEFDITAATYCIGGLEFTSAAQSVTLATADPSNPRIDVLYLDNTGAFGVITGTPATTPIAPEVDPTAQLAVYTQLVPAASTAPSVLTVLVYDEDTGPTTEWTGTTDGGGTIVLNSTNGSPEHGSHDTEATATVVGDYAKWVSGAGTITLSSNAVLTFWIKSKATWGAGMRLALRLQSGASSVGQVVALLDGTHGFNSSTTGSWQEIVLPLTAFQANGVPFDTLKVSVACAVGGTPAAIGFYLDWFNFVDIGAAGAPDSNLVQVDTADSTPGTLSAKTAAGPGIALTVLNPGGNEQLQISLNIQEDTLSITGSTNTLTFHPNKVLSVALYSNKTGVLTTDYSITGTTITWGATVQTSAGVTAVVIYY